VTDQPQTQQQAPSGWQTPPGMDPKAHARAAKAYAKASRPWYKKKRWILTLAVIVLIVIIAVSVSSSNKKTEQAAAKTCAGKSYPDQQPKDFCANASGTVALAGMTVTARPFKIHKDGLGDKGLCSRVTMKNTSGSSQDYNELDFKVQTPTGDVATLSTLSLGGTLNSGTLIAGAAKTGLVCTDYKRAQKGTYVFIYKPNPFEADRGIWLFKA